MPHMDLAPQLDLPQRQRQRHGRERDQHQHPEGVHVGEERRLCLHLLSDPFYARFANKRALFIAVVTQSVAANVARFEEHSPTGATFEERLESVAVPILQRVLVSDSVRLMRVAIAEAGRFPDLASRVHLMARERGAQAIARLLAEAAQSDELGRLPAFAPERLTTTTRFFQDLVFLPLLMRALFGEKLKLLRAEIGPHVARGIAFFLAACRNSGGIT